MEAAPFGFGQGQEGAVEKLSGFDDFGSSLSHRARMTSLELCKKMEVMGSGKLVALLIVKTPQYCGRNSACARAKYDLGLLE